MRGRNRRGSRETTQSAKTQRLVRPAFGSLIDRFLAKHRSRGGTDYYAHITKPLRAHFGNTPVAEIAAQALDGYLAKRRTEKVQKGEREGERKVGESTLRKEIIAAGTVLRWGKQRGLVAHNPVDDYGKPKEPAERNIVVLSPEQEEVLERNCPPRTWDCVEWALYSGMRRDEFLNDHDIVAL